MKDLKGRSKYGRSWDYVNIINELTKKNKENVVKWTEACECAFNSLKEAFTCKPVLITPDWARKFILQMDASATG